MGNKNCTVQNLLVVVEGGWDVGVQDRSEAESGVCEGVCAWKRRRVCQDYRWARCRSVQATIPYVVVGLLCDG